MYDRLASVTQIERLESDQGDQGCLNERTGCSEDLVTELLSCLRSIQRRSSISTRSPRRIPTYKLRFQPQSSARGSEVDATRNFRGAGMHQSEPVECVSVV
ncbi:hypothetical protein EYF80_041847 [Liparis tanakae]|uniref:Uncharacterized protein n=1 Tax=Liparis tanakae TaxID=230148 RepID=A0A4Z2G593_9TELE|nr:hypothetical protein EYF80_041847 [Liparis tanakae]